MKAVRDSICKSIFGSSLNLVDFITTENENTALENVTNENLIAIHSI